MPHSGVISETRDHIAYITLARPEHGNRLNETMLAELREACAAAADGEATRAVVLAAQGPAFCLGWEESTDLASLRTLADGFQFLAGLPCPTIAAMAGDALSAGLELALACDLRIAAADTRFGFPEVGQGLIPMAGGTQRLPRIVGRAKALEMILLADPITAQEAHQIGLLNLLVDKEEVLVAASALARRIAERGPIAVGYAKEAIQQGLDMPLPQALRLEADLAIILQTTEDRAEGVRAFQQRRPPRFRGR